MQQDIDIRPATKADITAILELVDAGRIDDSTLNAKKDSDLTGYEKAFERIQANNDSMLMVACKGSQIVGTFQLNFITYLIGMSREDAQVENVHVHRNYRSSGIGSEMMRWCISEAKKRNCRRVQLTTDKKRKDAHRFYERLGFKSSHEGMKLIL
jgi:GNAT superfamily N-acetyltransferase